MAWHGSIRFCNYISDNKQKCHCRLVVKRWRTSKRDWSGPHHQMSVWGNSRGNFFGCLCFFSVLIGNQTVTNRISYHLCFFFFFPLTISSPTFIYFVEPRSASVFTILAITNTHTDTAIISSDIFGSYCTKVDPVEEESDKFLNLSLLTLNSHCRRFWRFELNCFRFWEIWVCVDWRWGARRMIRWWPWSWWVVPLKVNAICLFVLFHLQQIMGCFFLL